MILHISTSIMAFKDYPRIIIIGLRCVVCVKTKREHESNKEMNELWEALKYTNRQGE